MELRYLTSTSLLPLNSCKIYFRVYFFTIATFQEHCYYIFWKNVVCLVSIPKYGQFFKMIWHEQNNLTTDFHSCFRIINKLVGPIPIILFLNLYCLLVLFSKLKCFFSLQCGLVKYKVGLQLKNQKIGLITNVPPLTHTTEYVTITVADFKRCI